MTGSGACSSFSVATTVFVSLAICAVISYGVFYYFKQRLARIEHSQMEQARIMQAIISRGLAAQQSTQPTQSTQSTQLTQSTQPDQKSSQKEITITQSSLIEVSSDDDDDDESASSPESESESDEDSNESDDSDESSESKWSIGDEIHQADGYHEEFTESFKKNILIDAICIDSGYQVESVTIEDANADNTEESQHKRIISLNRGALNNHDDDSDSDDDDDSSSSEDQDQDPDQDPDQDQDQDLGKGKGKGKDNDKDNDKDKDNDNDADDQEFELKIGYKPSSSSLNNKAMQLNYGNMSVSALRQLAKERGVGGEEADLQKLKKKELVQLLAVA